MYSCCSDGLQIRSGCAGQLEALRLLRQTENYIYGNCVDELKGIDVTDRKIADQNGYNRRYGDTK